MIAQTILNVRLLTPWVSEGHIAVSGVPDETLDYRSVVDSAEKVNLSFTIPSKNRPKVHGFIVFSLLQIWKLNLLVRNAIMHTPSASFIYLEISLRLKVH